MQKNSNNDAKPPVSCLHQKWSAFLQETSKTAGTAPRKRYSIKKYACDRCKRKFVLLSGLERHRKKFHSEDQQPEDVPDAAPMLYDFDAAIKCKGCGEVFPESKYFLCHSRQFNWEHLLTTLPGEYLGKEKEVIQCLMNIVTISDVYRCEFCNACFSDVSSLFRHESFHDPAEAFECTFCNLKIPTLGAYLAHRESCPDQVRCETLYFPNVPIRYCCNVCGNLYLTLPELYEHRHAEMHYFPRRSSMAQHATQNAGLLVNCEICGTHWDEVTKFKDHRAGAHSDTVGVVEVNGDVPMKENQRPPKGETQGTTVRPYLCDKCGKTYTQSSHLWQHLRFHNGVRPFACPMDGCKRRFTIRPDLNDHIRKCHTGERPYECEVCHKRFLTGSVYYQHRLIHRGERRYGCPDCPRRFYRADALKNHQRIHTGEKPYSCLHCERKFRQRGDREKHMRVKHMKFR